MYVFCGNEPFCRDIMLDYADFGSNVLRLKALNQHKSLIHLLMNDDNLESCKMNKNEKEVIGNSQIKCRRTKERKIGYIIGNALPCLLMQEKVNEWRKLYNGDIVDSKGKQIRLSLEEASQKVKISKKSLDDYLLQIRLGRKLGFNFNENY